MALLGAVSYDPATAVTTKANALQAMTAVDTTNCRVTFTAPAAGPYTGTRDVLIRIRANQSFGTSAGVNSMLFGVLEGSTVIARQAPVGARTGTTSTQRQMMISEFVVTNISSGSHSYDLAIGVEQVLAAAAVAYGGPNNTTANDAWGSISMEVWEASNLLAAANYDPATIVSKGTASATAMTAFDTTNLRCTFTAPASGNVLVVMRGCWVAPSTSLLVSVLFGVLESSTVLARGQPIGGLPGGGTVAAGGFVPLEHSQTVTGISAGSHSYDAAYATEITLASSNIQYGGPNNATTNDAAGMFRFEVWAA